MLKIDLIKEVSACEMRARKVRLHMNQNVELLIQDLFCCGIKVARLRFWIYARITS